MANTYYDSELTAEEIEEVLEAINGILTPANNGKVLAISNGRFEARSVQWGGGGAVVQPLSVTQNGIYNPPSGVDGYAPVTVNVSGGGGSSNILSGILTPNAGIGNNGDIYLQYAEAYLFGDGTCYIDTGISSLDVYGFEFIFSPAMLVSAYQTYLGAVTDNFTIGQITNLNTIYIRRRTIEDIQAAIESPCKITYLDGVFLINGVQRGSYDDSVPVSTQSSNIYIFSGVSGARKSSMRFYGLKLYGSNDNLLFDGIPANNNGVACVYDRVSSTYIVPVGTATYYSDSSIIATFAKVNGSWQSLIGTDINDINLGGN